MGRIEFMLITLFMRITCKAFETLEVTSTGGSYRGRYLLSLRGRRFGSFSGVPYAHPPIGPLRFKEAVSLNVLDDIYDASIEKDDCIQLHSNYNKYSADPSKQRIYVGSEDCLYLNIYTPNVNPKKPFPVMVMIHGGANLKGSGSSQLLGPEIFMDRDVVLVTINYRLGLFGFLSLDDDLAPGNLGLKDQSLALDWIKENINAFGGDPGTVTVFGESAGGASTNLHMKSPRSQGKFIRAISQSGTADCVWAIQQAERGRANALALAKSVGCLGPAPQTLECLRNKSVETLLNATRELSVYSSEAIFNTVVEKNHKNAFLTREMLESETLMSWMAGVNSAEGLIVYGEIAESGDPDLLKFNKTYKTILPRILRYSESPNNENITKRIKKHYFQDKSITKERVGDLINLFSDSMFYHGQAKAARKHKGPLYQYYFSHMGQRRYNPLLTQDVARYGADHGEELLYLFHYKKVYPTFEFNKEDLEVSNLLLDLWTNFATYGDPTLWHQVKWPESEQGKFTAEINKSGIQLRENLLNGKIHFWDDLENAKYQLDEF